VPKIRRVPPTTHPPEPSESHVTSSEARGSVATLASLGETLDSVQDPMVILRPVFDEHNDIIDFEYTAANEAATQFLHVSRLKLVGSRLKDHDEAETPGLFSMYQHVFETGEPLALDDFVYPNVVTQDVGHFDIRGSKVGETVSFTWRDVTDRELLIDHYRLLAENASDVVFRVDAELNLEWISPSVHGLQGFDPEEILGRPLSDFCHPDDLESVIRLVDETPAGQKGEMEFRIRRADGDYRWVSLIGRKVYDQDDKTEGYVGSLRDIDAEHEARRSQHEANRRYRLLATNTSDVVMVSHAGGAIQWVSDSVTAISGWRPEDLVGRRFADFVHADDQAIMDATRALLEQGEVGRPTVRLRTANGDYHWISVHVRDVIDEATGERQRVASWRDAEQEVSSRAALEASEQNFRLLAENASDVVWRTFPDGRFEWVSPSVEWVLGWRPEELVGTSVFDLVAPEDREEWEDDRTQVLRGGAMPTRQVRYRTVAGQYLWMSVHLGALHDDDGNAVRVVCGLRDVSKLVESRDRLSQSEARFRLLAENASDVVVQLDDDLVFRWVSPSVEQVLGWPPAALLGRSATDFILTEDPAGLGGARSAAEVVHAGLVRFRQSDGTYLWMSARSKSTRDNEALAPGRVMALRDVNAEVSARETLIASESRFRLLAENASDLVLETDADTLIRWVSPSVQRVLGWRPDQWIGHDPLEFMHDDDLEMVRAHREVALKGARTAPLEVRFRDVDGAYHWMSGEDHLVRGRAGEVVTRIIGLRGIDAEVAALESMAHAEDQYRLLAENASDIVLRIDIDSRITWISPSVELVLGWKPDDLLGTTTWQFLVEEDRERVVELRRRFFAGETIDTFEVRAVRPNGDIRWLSMRPRAIHDEQGTITSTVMSIRDVHSEVLARHAITTLSAGSRALIRADDEIRLLHEMCEIATGEGGYALAWYARRVDDDARSVVKLASSAQHRQYLDEIEVSWDEGPHGQGPVGRSLRLNETIVSSDFRSDASFTPWLRAALNHGLRTAVALPVRVGTEVDGALLVYASEADAFDQFAVSVLENLAAELGYGLNRLREQARLLQALHDQKLLSSAIEQAAETVLILDPSYTIIYANPSTARTSGYRLDEIIGRRPAMFGAGVSPPEYFDDIAATLARGEAWRGTFVNRRKDGEIYEEDTTISPIHDEDGQLVAYVEVKSDLTTERQLESDLSRTQADRSSFVEVMHAVRSATTVHATAYLFCEAAIQLPGIDLASVLLLQDDAKLLPISVSGTEFWDVNEERTLNAAPELLHRLADGPLLVSTNPATWNSNVELAEQLSRDGFLALVYSAIRWEGSVIGILGLATKSPESVAHMSKRLGYFEEIAAYAGTLIGAQAKSFERRSVVRSHIRDVIDRRSFRPYFQPVIDLKSGDVVGYEALTRFDDGTPPDQKILEAHSVGFGPELEAVIATAALRAADDLPPEVFLSVNFSPDTLLDGHAKAVVAGVQRPVVIEITEHAPIENYAAIRRAMSKLKGCVLAVDDAGAGYTSLSHILELQPRYVKLDITLVHDIDTNAARQAMVAGMCHFALQSKTILVAEGVESQAEAEMLRRLGVSLAEGSMLAQGFHFGRPAPIA